jgi:hypothetical protein
MAGTVDVYCDEDVSFAVGTKLMLVGQAWRSREGEDRLSVNGWYAFDEIAGVAESTEGWDE